jgi:hypothetical protein
VTKVTKHDDCWCCCWPIVHCFTLSLCVDFCSGLWATKQVNHLRQHQKKVRQATFLTLVFTIYLLRSQKCQPPCQKACCQRSNFVSMHLIQWCSFIRAPTSFYCDRKRRQPDSSHGTFSARAISRCNVGHVHRRCVGHASALVLRH